MQLALVILGVPACALTLDPTPPGSSETGDDEPDDDDAPVDDDEDDDDAQDPSTSGSTTSGPPPTTQGTNVEEGGDATEEGGDPTQESGDPSEEGSSSGPSSTDPGTSETGLVSCDAELTCAGCIDCSITRGVCAESADSCYAMPACASIAECAYDCLGLAADLVAYTQCIEDCVAPFPAGADAFYEVLACLERTCYAACV